LPLGLMGFPGVGWLFAGFPFTASILLCAGPALAWAVIPIAFSPFGEGPLREIGWKVELAWLPASALVSSAALYRAHARRRALLDGRTRPPRGRRRLTPSSYRARVGLAAGAIVLLLVSLPFLPAVAGIGSSAVRYSYEPRFTREVTGQFLVTARGPIKLFAWGDPQGSYPSDALRLRSGDVRSLLVRAAQVDAPGAYQLYDLERGGGVPLRVVRRSATVLSLEPARRLRPGRYAFVAAHEGMFGGRDAYYLAGGVLTVAYLGAGSAWLLLPRRARDLMLGGLATATVAAASAVALAPVDAAKVVTAPSSRPPANSALGGHAFLWAIGLNS